MNNLDVRVLTDEQLEVVADLMLDFPSVDAKILERIDLGNEWLDYDSYGYSVSYMIALGEELFTCHVSQFQGCSIMSVNEEGDLDFCPTFNQFAIVDYIRNVHNNIIN